MTKSLEKPSCRHKVPVFQCEGCLHKRGPLYDNEIESVMNLVEEEATKVFEELDNLKRPPARLSNAITNLYDAITEIWEVLPTEE